MDWRELVYKAVRKIPKGKVSTYGNIAKYIKVSPRVVGYALHHNPDPENIPCHRVVDRNGKLAENFAFGGWKYQKELLLAEGVRFKDTMHVDFVKGVA